MSLINRKIILDTLIKHETLTIDDIGKQENLGISADPKQLKFLLSQLTTSGHIQILSGAEPITYSITTSGIEEGERLKSGATI